MKKDDNGTSPGPNSNGENGKDAKTGRFLPGNNLGTGTSPFAERKSAFRAVLIKAMTEKQLDKVAKALFKAAENGEPWAVKEVLDRLLGKPKESVEITGELTVADFFRQVVGRDPLVRN